MAGAPVGSLWDYVFANQGLDAAQAAASDVAGSAASSALGLSSLADPITAALGVTSLLSMIPGLGDLNPINDIISAFQGRPKMQATQDIASAANNTDPVIALLGEGAQQLNSKGVPISSSNNQASSFGPYFQVASDLENLVRWGTTNPTPQQAQLTATTLKNALTELGNPGKAGTQTLQALQQAWQQGLQNLSPQALQQLVGQMSPEEQNIFNSLGLTQNQSTPQATPGPGNQAPPAPPTPGAAPTAPIGNYTTDQMANYANQLQNYATQLDKYAGATNNSSLESWAQNVEQQAQQAQQYAQKMSASQQPASTPSAGPAYPNYGGPQPGIYPSGGQTIDQMFGGPHRQPGNPFRGWDSKQVQPIIEGQQGGNRPANCPPCPPSGSQGGGNNQGGNNNQTGNTTTGPNNQNLIQLLEQLIGQSGNNTGNPPGSQTGNTNPVTGGNWLNILNQLLGNTTTGTPGTGTTTPPSATPATTPPSSNPLNSLANLATLGGLAGLFGSPGGFSYNWTVV